MSEIFKHSDSIEAKFMKAALLNNRASTQMKKRMATTFLALERVAKEGRWGNVDPSTLTVKQVKKLVQTRLEEGISERTLQTEMAHVRRSLGGVGREEFAQITCENKMIGVPPASRIGKGKVVDPDILANALKKAGEDTKVMILLPRTVGLRQEEFVSAAESLHEWKRALIAGQPLMIRDGTKGGRNRSVFIPPSGVPAALGAVIAAIKMAKEQGGRLVVSVSLDAAKEQHGDRLAAVGLKGENAGHSLRRAFAMDGYIYYLSAGVTQEGSNQKTEKIVR